MGNNNMKLSFSIVIILIMLFAPLTFNIFSDENAYAMGRSGGHKKKSARVVSSNNTANEDNKDEDSGKFGEYVFTNQEGQDQHNQNSGGVIFVDGDNTAGVQTPEPATLLLLSGGAAGLVVLRRKFKK